MSPSAPALPHFSMLHAAVRQEISRLRVSIECPHFLIPSCGSARNDTAAWKHRFMGKGMNSKSTAPPSTCHPERQRRILVHGAGVPMVLNTSLRGVTCLASDFHSLSFQPQRRGVGKSHPSMLHAPMRKEISRLRVSIERSPISSHRHVAPLEMTRRRAAYRHFRNHSRMQAKQKDHEEMN